ncbi:MAG: alpha/beta hydrolase [Candidatus Gracilibacteria bacterium]
MKKIIKNLFVIVLVFVVFSMFFVRFAYPYVLYPAPKDSGPIVSEGFELVSTGGAEFLYSPSEGDAKTIVYFHGNGETLNDIVYIAQKYSAYGFGIAVMEYPGYGDLDGDTTEETIYASADTVFDYLNEQGVSNEKIAVIGYSLGSGVATEMVYRGFGSELVLIAPYTSIPDVAQRFIPFLPVDFLIPEHFDTYEKAASIIVPTLIIHGDVDMTIPYDMGVELSQVFENAQFVTLEGKGHHDYFDDETIGVVAEFVMGRNKEVGEVEEVT